MTFLIVAVIPFLTSASTLNFLNNGGLLEEMNLVLLVNTVAEQFAALVVDGEMWKRLGLNFLLERFMKNVRKIEADPSDLETIKEIRMLPAFTQRESHEIVRGLAYNISDYYSYTLSFIATTFFYFSMFPFGIVYVLLGILGMYWTCKVSRIRLFSYFFILVTFGYFLIFFLIF